MKIIKGNFHTNDEIVNLANEIANNHFKQIDGIVGIFQSTKDFILIDSSPIPAITVGRYDAKVTLAAHPFLEGISESFEETHSDYLVCISDKGKFKKNLSAILAHELRHVEQNVNDRRIMGQSQSLMHIHKHRKHPPHEKDAKLFEERYFGEPITINPSYEWRSETIQDFEYLKNDFNKLLDLFIEMQKLDIPPVLEEQPEGLTIPVVGELYNKDDLNFYIHNLRIALGKI